MKDFIEKLISRLEEAEKYCLEMYDWQGQTAILEAIEIVNQLAEEYMTCYKSCTECEAYDKEKHYCPKFCYIIAETVKEIEENHKGGWIPVSERLPEVNGWYLVTNTLGVVHQQHWGASHWEKVTDESVIAWMPLPPAYKGE